jgi:CubicO group peptidase (beta-lactamase class C family)
VLATLLFSSVLASSGIEEARLADRLARLREDVEQRRELLHLSGLSLAVVLKDEVVFAGGFGLRDQEAKLAADEHTLYGIASTTKAFTSMLCAMLVAEGKLDWDGRPATWMPEVKFRNPVTDKQTRLRDLLAHRTGLTRTDVAWIGTNATRAQLIGQLAHAENFAPFGVAFQYNNTQYLLAGEIAAKVAGKPSWDELLEERLLVPLGMTNSTSHATKSHADPRMAKGYDWDATKNAFEPVPLLNADNCAPAGGIASNVVDMAKWVRFLLRRGEWGGRQLVPAEQFDEMWRAYATADPNNSGGPSYGLGWMLHEKDGQEWRDPAGERHRVVEHGGNLPGSCASVAVLPSHGAGLVMLANASASQLQASIIPLVFDALFGDSRPRAEWNDGEPLPKERWSKWIGTFTGGMEGRANNSLIEQGGRPTLVIPPGLGLQATTVYTLGWPDAQGRCWLREEPEAYVTVVEGEGGAAEALEFVHGFVRRRMKAVVARNRDLPPDLSQDEFFAKREERIGGEKAAEWKTVRLTGTVRFLHGGVTGRWTMVARGPDTLRIDYDADPFGHSTTIVANGRGTIRASLGSTESLSPVQVAALLRINPIVEAGAWIDWTDDVELKRVTWSSSLGLPLGGPCYEVILSAAAPPAMAYYVSTQTFDTVAIEGVVGAFPGLPYPVTVALLSDWREVEGVRVAFKREFTNAAAGTTTLQLESVEVDVELDDARFNLPAAAGAAPQSARTGG